MFSFHTMHHPKKVLLYQLQSHHIFITSLVLKQPQWSADLHQNGSKLGLFKKVLKLTKKKYFQNCRCPKSHNLGMFERKGRALPTHKPTHHYQPHPPPTHDTPTPQPPPPPHPPPTAYTHTQPTTTMKLR
jgi:hypothetical protein